MLCTTNLDIWDAAHFFSIFQFGEVSNLFFGQVARKNTRDFVTNTNQNKKIKPATSASGEVSYWLELKLNRLAVENAKRVWVGRVY